MVGILPYIATTSSPLSPDRRIHGPIIGVSSSSETGCILEPQQLAFMKGDNSSERRLTRGLVRQVRNSRVRKAGIMLYLDTGKSSLPRILNVSDSPEGPRDSQRPLAAIFCRFTLRHEDSQRPLVAIFCRFTLRHEDTSSPYVEAGTTGNSPYVSQITEGPLTGTNNSAPSSGHFSAPPSGRFSQIHSS